MFELIAIRLKEEMLGSINPFSINHIVSVEVNKLFYVFETFEKLMDARLNPIM
ncbi:hypothetical protein [Peribacillus butanolivorans]|uniref:hypothetical protein n=1 Tax=Peribacillus butanolivorans TaxID=421767 RepID=UPI001596B48C|nr:hypothetical protein [Peribacillus butanolivorans]